MHGVKATRLLDGEVLHARSDDPESGAELSGRIEEQLDDGGGQEEAQCGVGELGDCHPARRSVPEEPVDHPAVSSISHPHRMADGGNSRGLGRHVEGGLVPAFMSSGRWN